MIAMLDGLTITRPDKYADVWMYRTQLTACCVIQKKTVSPFCLLASRIAAVDTYYKGNYLWALTTQRYHVCVRVSSEATTNS
jgi:hypothetical protein